MSVPEAALLLDLPFRGTWMARNSPARRVPSHGTHLYGTTYAIDFILVDAAGHSAATSDWRSWVFVEPPGRFLGFGAPILAPISGTVVASHDGEPDHVARRFQLALVPYALSQPTGQAGCGCHSRQPCDSGRRSCRSVCWPGALPSRISCCADRGLRYPRRQARRVW